MCHQASSRASSPTIARKLADDYEGEVQAVWQCVLPGAVMKISAQSAKRLALDPRVLRVEQNQRRLPATAGELLATAPAKLGAATCESKSAGQQQICDCDSPDPNKPSSCTDNWGLDRIDQASGVRD